MDTCELAGIHKLAQWQNLYGVIEFHSLAPFHPAGANQFTPLNQILSCEVFENGGCANPQHGKENSTGVDFCI